MRCLCLCYFRAGPHEWLRDVLSDIGCVNGVHPPLHAGGGSLGECIPLADNPGNEGLVPGSEGVRFVGLRGRQRDDWLAHGALSHVCVGLELDQGSGMRVTSLP